MTIERKLLSSLATSLLARGVTLCRNERPNYVEMRILTIKLEERVICVISLDDLFDGDGNRFVNDLP